MQYSEYDVKEEELRQMMDLDPKDVGGLRFKDYAYMNNCLNTLSKATTICKKIMKILYDDDLEIRDSNKADFDKAA
jgi:hypothetical protein